MDDKNALRAVMRGDTRSLGFLIDKYTPYVSTILWHILGERMSAADVEEAASDVFLALWQNAGRIRSDSVKPYLSGIARHTALHKLRQAGLTLSLEEDTLPVCLPDPARAAEKRGERQLVRRAVLSMDQPDREIFLRHYYYGQSVSDIGQEMGLNASTVKTRLRRGREKLKNILIKGGYKDESEHIPAPGLLE